MLIAVGITVGLQFAVFSYIKNRSKRTVTILRQQRNEDFDVHIYEVMDRIAEPRLSITPKVNNDSNGSCTVNSKENEAYGAVDY